MAGKYLPTKLTLLMGFKLLVTLLLIYNKTLQLYINIFFSGLAVPYDAVSCLYQYHNTRTHRTGNTQELYKLAITLNWTSYLHGDN